METSNTSCFRVCIWVLCFAMAASLFKHCDARKPIGLVKPPKQVTVKQSKKLELISTIMSLVADQPTDTSNPNSQGVSSPFSLPAFESLAPNPLPENAPPFCVYPPLTPQTPSTIPTVTSPAAPSPVNFNFPPLLPGPNPPTVITPSPPAFSGTPNPPEVVPGPPCYIPWTPGSLPSPTTVPSPYQPILSPPYYEPSPPGTVPSPYQPILSPPYYEPSPPGTVPSPYQPILSPPYYEPSPPGTVPSPPVYVPSPPSFLPRPPVFLPPVVYPPPTVPPPPSIAPVTALWCMAKPSVPDPIIQEAMNYACASVANCDSIQPSGSCFEPNTLFAHASYAFNSFWQRTKNAGGTCEFGGTAILVTVDPSYDGCHFDYN